MVVAKFAITIQQGAQSDKTQTHMTGHYNLDVIISIGYRVKSQRGVEFRKRTNAVLKDFILNGYAVIENRLVCIPSGPGRSFTVREIRRKLSTRY